MKTFKKLGSLAIALALVLSTMLVSASAASFTVKNAVNDQTYSAYKVFDVTKNSSNYSYTYVDDAGDNFLDTLQSYTAGLTVTKIGATNTYNVVPTGSFDAATLAGLLVNDATKPSAAATKVAASGTAVLDGLADGYYLIVSDMTGAVPILVNVPETTEKSEKQTLPDIEKKVYEDSSASFADSNTAAIGDVIDFQITIKTEGTAAGYVLEDTLPSALTLLNPHNIVVMHDGDTIDEGAGEEYTLELLPNASDPTGFRITFDSDFLSTVDAYDNLVVTYSATLNDTAAAKTPYTNTATLEYTGGAPESSSTVTKTYAFPVFKFDGNTDAALSGATFKLTTDDAGANVVKFDDISSAPNATFRHNTAGAANAFTTDSTTYSAIFTLTGLDAGTYYLHETAAPAGYNQLTTPVTVVIAEDGTVTQDGSTVTQVAIENLSGSLLPETGGIGTTIFYTVGGLLVVGAGILLITKKRMSVEQ